MADGYYFKLPAQEAKNIILRSGVIFAASFLGLTLLINGNHYLDVIVFINHYLDLIVCIALAHVSGYLLLLRHKYVFLSPSWLRGESPWGRTCVFSWSDKIVVRETSVTGIAGYVLQRNSVLDTIFIPKAIFESPQFHAITEKFAPNNHVLLSHAPGH